MENIVIQKWEESKKALLQELMNVNFGGENPQHIPSERVKTLIFKTLGEKVFGSEVREVQGSYKEFNAPHISATLYEVEVDGALFRSWISYGSCEMCDILMSTIPFLEKQGGIATKRIAKTYYALCLHFVQHCTKV